MNLRLRFVTEWQHQICSMTELCADYGISRKTGYKWVARFTRDGAVGLTDQSRRPHQSPHATDPARVRRLLELRARHPTWGARKLLARARRDGPALGWPSRSTVCDLLQAHGFVRTRVRPHRSGRLTVPLRVPTAPNETWTTDFKGQFRTRDGRYCYPLTVRDGFSRYVLRCDALLTTSYAVTRPCFERAFQEYGLPERIRSDNGGPFASTGFAGLSRLSVWWLRLGIALERTAPAHPEQNGSHEQFHRVLKAQTTHPPAADAGAQQHRFVRFQAEYNEERPHEALLDQVPAEWYQPSRRALPRRLPPLEYPPHWEVRRVATSGHFSWRGHLLFLAEALAGEHIGLEEVADGLWTIHFARVPVGRFDERTRELYPLAAVTGGALRQPRWLRA